LVEAALVESFALAESDAGLDAHEARKAALARTVPNKIKGDFVIMWFRDRVNM